MRAAALALVVAASLFPVTVAHAADIEWSAVSHTHPGLFLALRMNPGVLSLGALHLRVQKEPAASRLGAIHAETAAAPEKAADFALAYLLDARDGNMEQLAVDSMSLITSDDGRGQNLLTLSLALDWTTGSQKLAPATRTALATQVSKWAREALDRLDDLGPREGTADIFDHDTFALWRSALVASLAVDDAALYGRAWAVWRDRLGPALCNQSGAWHEGASAALDVGRAVAEVTLALEGATGLDARRGFGCPESLTGLDAFAAAMLLPDGGWIPLADTNAQNGHAAPADRVAAETLAALPTAPDGGEASRGAASLLASLGVDYPAGQRWSAVLFEGGGAAVTSVEEFARFGNASAKGDLGLFVARSGAGTSSTLRTFKAGDYFGRRDHLDQGHFNIWHKGWLALDSGIDDGPGSAHREAYAMRSVAHNVPTLFVKGELFQTPWKDVSPVNDGGQRTMSPLGTEIPPTRTIEEYVARRVASPHFATGTVLSSSFASGFAVIQADLTQAYASESFSMGNAPKMKSVRRTLVWTDGLTLVRDRIVPTSRVAASMPTATFLLHTAVAPVKDGALWVVENGGVLGVRTFGPATTTVVGDGGLSFLVDGQNFVPKAPEPLPPFAGTHRLEISTPASPDATLLNVLQTADTRAELKALAEAETANDPGAQIVHVGGDVFIFAVAAKEGWGASYDAHSTGALRHHVIGVPSQANLVVAQNGFELTRGTADTSGNFSFTSSEGGTFRVAVEAPKPDDVVTPGDGCFEGSCGKDFVGDDFREGCSCSSASTPSVALFAALGLVLLRRKRRA